MKIHKQHAIVLLMIVFLLFCLFPGCRKITSEQDIIEALEERVEYLEEQNKLLELEAKVVSLREKRIEKLQAEIEQLQQELDGKIDPLYDDRTGLWEMQYDKNKTRPVLVKEYDRDKVTVKQLEDEINRRYAQEDSGPRIKVDRIEDGIAFVEVLEGEWLTQRMGSAGPFEYVGRVTLTLTSLPEIDHVYLYGFEPGDHWGPGCLSRADVAGWREWWSGW